MIYAERFFQCSHILYEILIAFKLSFLLKIRSIEVSFYPRNEYPASGVDIRSKKNKSILLLRGYHPMLNMPRIIKTVGN